MNNAFMRNSMRKSLCVLCERHVSRSCIRLSRVRPLSYVDSKNMAFRRSLPAQFSQEGMAVHEVMEPVQSHSIDISSQNVVYKYATVISALMQYKEVYGDMLVPNEFMVPADDVTWPQESWGMKLGLALNRIKLVQSHKVPHEDLGVMEDSNLEVMKTHILAVQLENMKSTKSNYMSLLAWNYQLAKTALLRYMEIHGTMQVPLAFVVPALDDLWPTETRGMKLGEIARKIRCQQKHRKHMAELESIGFEFPSRRAKSEYSVVKSALLRFKEINGDMLVPASFAVPVGDNAWPEDIWGLKLGTSVAGIRGGRSFAGHREDLKSIGFEYQPRNQILLKYDVAKAALLRYQEIHSHMRVPSAFIVPTDDDSWPEETWALRLGLMVTKIRGGRIYNQQQEDLEGIGFDYYCIKQRGFDAVKAALLRYKEIHGDMRPKQAFVVPTDDAAWPEVTWGMKLGIAVNKIRFNRIHNSQREELERIGFDYRPKKNILSRYCSMKSALLRYKELHGTMRVPATFIVPANDESWPEEAWGMKLGTMVTKIRGGRIYNQQREELEGMGFDYRVTQPRGYDAVKAALLRYKEIHGDMRVPQLYQVPTDDAAWPEGMWGMNLGAIVSKIRFNRIYTDQREELLRIGIDYRLQTNVVLSYQVAKSALLRYKEIHGDMRVPQMFKIPRNEVSWPEETRGIVLGALVGKIRIGQSYNAQREELESLGFDYYKRPSLRFVEFKSALLRYKEIHGDMIVPKNFSVPADDAAWPENTWSMKLGDAVARVRRGELFKSKKEQFEQIGF